MGTAASNVNLTVTYRGIDQTTKAGNRARKSIRGVGGAAGKATSIVNGLTSGLSQMAGGNITGGLGKMIASFGALGTAAAATALAMKGFQAAQEAIVTHRTFSEELGKIQTLIGSDVQRMETLEAGIRAVSKRTGKSLEDIAGGVYLTISAFGDADDTLQKVEIAAKAGAAGLTETAEAVKLANVFMKNYGDTSAAAAEKALDLAFITNKLGFTTFPEIAASMAGVVPLAAKLGVTQEELTAAYAALLGTSGNAAEVTTQLKSAMFGLADQAKGANKILRDHGFASAEAAVAELGLLGALQKVNEASDGTVGSLKELFGRKEAVLGILPLITTQQGKYTQALEVATSSTGTAKQAFSDLTTGMGEHAQVTKEADAALANLETRVGGIGVAYQKTKLRVLEFVDSLSATEIAATLTFGVFTAQYHALKALGGAFFTTEAETQALKDALIEATPMMDAWTTGTEKARKANLSVAASLRVRRDALGNLAKRQARSSEFFKSTIESEEDKEKRRHKSRQRREARRVKAIAAAAAARRKAAAEAATLEREQTAARKKNINRLTAMAAEMDRKRDERTEKAAQARRDSFAAAISQAQALQSAIGGTQSTVGDLLVALPALGAAAATALGKSETKMQDALAIGQTAILGIVAADGQRSIAAAKNEAERARAIEAAERKKAAVLAIMAAAQAYIAFASGNIPGAASAAAAAVLYAGVAGGAIKTGSAAGGGMASTGSTTGGGGTMATGTADAAPSTGAINVNFGAGFVFGTKQQVGRAVAGSLRSLQTTGLATAGGV